MENRVNEIEEKGNPTNQKTNMAALILSLSMEVTNILIIAFNYFNGCNFWFRASMSSLLDTNAIY